MAFPIGPEHAADRVPRLGEETRVVGAHLLVGCAGPTILGLVAKSTELGEQDSVRGTGIFRVQFKDGTLEVLDHVGLAVEVTDLGELVGDGVSLLVEAAMRLPVLPKHPADGVPGFREGVARFLAVDVAGKPGEPAGNPQRPHHRDRHPIRRILVLLRN